MAKYTIELRRVCELYTRNEVEKWFKSYNIEDYLTPEQINVINQTGLWNKDKLAKKIVSHYFMREIGFETPALFKLYAENMMNELMEEKLPLIYSSAIQYDPLVNVDFTETFERTQNNEQKQKLSSSTENKTNETGQNSSSGSTDSSSESNSESSSNSNSSGLSINNDTPEGRIIKEDILNGNYASEVTANESESEITDETNQTTTNSTQTVNSSNSKNVQEQTGNTSGNNTITDENKENYIKKIKGNSGVSATAQKMIEQYRQNIIAIDKEIIEELNILFMGIY